MKVSIKYGSHLPVLTKLVEMTSGPILELGVGLYSTPYLHYACLPKKRELTSYEGDEGWMRSFKDCRTDFHQVHFIANWDDLPIDKFWDIVFIDHGPDTRRKDEAKKLANNAKYIILHDSTAEHDYLYKYSEIYPLFKYRYDYKLAEPHTTVLSNFESLENIW
jgi:hypothetical protein